MSALQPIVSDPAAPSLARFRRAEVPVAGGGPGEYHLPLDESLDGHLPDWTVWARDHQLGLEQRCCAHDGCTLDEWRVPPSVVGDEEGMEPVRAEVMVGGRVMAAPAPCQHRTFNQQVVVARLTEDGTELSATVGWRLQVKVRCAECGVPMQFRTRQISEHAGGGNLVRRVDVPDAELSQDRRTVGVLMEPVPEAPDEWSQMLGIGAAPPG